MPFVIRQFCVLGLVLTFAVAAEAGNSALRPLLAQAGSAQQGFDELEGLKALGQAVADPATVSPSESPEAPRETNADDAGPTAESAPAVARPNRNPSPGDGFDELDGLKSFSQDWESLARSADGGDEAVSGGKNAAAAAARPGAASSQETVPSQETAALEDPEPKLRFDEQTETRQGVVAETLPLLSEEAGQQEPAAPAAGGEGAVGAGGSEAPSALLEQEIGRLFDPQPLDDQELVLGALPDPGGRGPSADGEAGLPPSTSSVPKEEQAQILSQLEELNPVVATVGDEKIYWSDVTTTAKRLPERYQGRLETVFPILLQRIVDLKLLAIAGRQQGLDQAEDLRARVAAYEERLVSQAYVQGHLEGAVTSEALKDRYNEVVQERAARTRIRARHILLKTEADARQVIEELDQGADFIELAETRSIGASAANGGSLGRFSVDRMVPAFSAAALALSPGQYSREPVLTQFGWHVILLEEGADQRSPDYAGLEADLRREVSEREIDRLLRDLRVNAQIEFFPDPDLTAGGAAATAKDEAAPPE